MRTPASYVRNLRRFDALCCDGNSSCWWETPGDLPAVVGAALAELEALLTPVWVAVQQAYVPCVPVAIVLWQLEVPRAGGQPQWPLSRSLRAEAQGRDFSWFGSGLGEWACDVFASASNDWELLELDAPVLTAIDRPLPWPAHVTDLGCRMFVRRQLSSSSAGAQVGRPAFLPSSYSHAVV